MLVPMEMLAKAQAMTVADLNAALANAGYDDHDELRDCRFMGMDTNGTFCYSINFEDPDSEEGVGAGMVYITMRRKPMSSKFEFMAEY